MAHKRAGGELEEPAPKRLKTDAAAAPAGSGSGAASAAGAVESKAAASSAMPNYAKSDSFNKSSDKARTRLHKELQRSLESKEFSVGLVENDLFLWEAKIPFDASTLLGQDLAKYTKDKSVVIRMAFDPTHPFKPPFVRVLRPRFQAGTSNVQEGGAICMDSFTTAGWSPAITAEKAILSVQSLLLTPTIISRLDPNNHAKEYSVEEAIKSQAFVLSVHKDWTKPPTGSGAGSGSGAAVPYAAPAAGFGAGAGAGAKKQPKAKAARGRKKR